MMQMTVKTGQAVSRACMYILPICMGAILLATPGMCAIIVPGSGESIQSAIDRAKPGDTVDVPGGTYQENIYVDKQLKLRGRNDRGKPTVIAAQSKGEAIFLDANGCSIEGFEIRNGEGCLVSSRHRNWRSFTIPEFSIPGTGR